MVFHKDAPENEKLVLKRSILGLGRVMYLDVARMLEQIKRERERGRDRQTDRQPARQTETDRQTSRQTVRDRQTDRDKQTDRQTDTGTCD